MTENKHGFKPKDQFTMGGINWTIIQTDEDYVKCLATECVGERAFDSGNDNNFVYSNLGCWLNGEFLESLTLAGVPEEIFAYFDIDLTADDGLRDYRSDRVRIGLITCGEYRALRENIPPIPNHGWWTATPDSPTNEFVKCVTADGTLNCFNVCNWHSGVRPLCKLNSEILKSYLYGDRENSIRGDGLDRLVSLMSQMKTLLCECEHIIENRRNT